jgi:hypothetical protein
MNRGWEFVVVTVAFPLVACHIVCLIVGNGLGSWHKSLVNLGHWLVLIQRGIRELWRICEAGAQRS